MATPLRRARLWRQGLALVLVMTVAPVTAWSAEPISFNRDIRPILSDNCFQCHGPDAAKRQADLRLDVEASAKGALGDGGHALVPNQPEASEVYRRVTSTDGDVQMPPPASGKRLTPAQAELIGRWIREGAKWEKHWAFVTPRRPALPAVSDPAWPRNPIDAFVLARLEQERLPHAAEADRATLLRRVTLDVTGLGPTPEEADAFLSDTSPDAYERAVDRLLASPRFGERMAARWLDAARYADTSGYQTDGVRHMWRWRDWVIDAFNRNLPFDQFTVEQLAGDLLPEPSLDQLIATGFNRNHRANSEGGIIPEEYAVEYVIDRVETTATVWLGLTLGCARCHDHKFDPCSQREFYRLYAFFNNVPERGRALKVGNSPPMIFAPTLDQQRHLAELDAQLAEARATTTAMSGELATAEVQWAASLAADKPTAWAPSEFLVAHFALDGNTAESVAGGKTEVDGVLAFTPGALGEAASLAENAVIQGGDVADFGYFDKFTFSAWIWPKAAGGTVLARMGEAKEGAGYSLLVVDGKLQLNLINRWLDDALRVETVESVASDRWQHVTVTYDGSRSFEGVKIYFDGQPQPLKVLLDELYQTFATPEPLRLGGGGPGTKFSGLLDDVRIYKANLAADDVALLALRDSIDAIAAIAPAQRTPAQAAKLRAYYLEYQAAASVRDAHRKVVELARQRLEYYESCPTTMVMQDASTPHDAFVLERGQYDKPGDKVTAGVPECLPPLGPTVAGKTDRLALARWLVDPSHPLTARVTVNRLWQSLFGTGLVKTVDDFGAQGDAPSHPELLDWLATELIAHHWDLKSLVREIVTSSTYRQSSHASGELLERDPENRLLARGPRFRLPAEMIRDSALAASGLLIEHQGGPSVMPYQPPGLWKELTVGVDYTQDHGEKLYRRSLYTFFKRTIAPPSMITFDAASRDACTVRVARTNTPLQALAMLNEVTYVEAARLLAERAMTGATTSNDRITLAFRRAVGRAPRERELAVLTRGFERQLAAYRADPAAAEKLLAVGEMPRDVKLDACEVAAYTNVASLILNLDEVVTKE